MFNSLQLNKKFPAIHSRVYPCIFLNFRVSRGLSYAIKYADQKAGVGTGDWI